MWYDDDEAERDVEIVLDSRLQNASMKQSSFYYSPSENDVVSIHNDKSNNKYFQQSQEWAEFYLYLFGEPFI
jgi:hypothetical protein